MKLEPLYRAEFTIRRPGRRARGRRPEGRRQIVGSATHLAHDERYCWLKDGVCVCTGEVRLRPDESGTDLVLDVAELVWEPMAE